MPIDKADENTVPWRHEKVFPIIGREKLIIILRIHRLGKKFPGIPCQWPTSQLLPYHYLLIA
jgi:hypothetical protein